MKVCVIVGMGPGLSLGVAKRFGREGFAIAMLARRAQVLAQQKAALSAASITAEGFAADAGDAVSLAAALDRVAAEMGPIDVLVYNAAAVRYKPLSELTVDELIADFRVNVAGALAAAQKVIPSMRARGAGTVLFTGGGFALAPVPAMAALGIGKAGIRNLAMSLHAEHKDAGVHVGTVTICGLVKPGTVFDPDRIADQFWRLHAQEPGRFEAEIQYRG
jgi:short-subunit dehydrogenase